MSMKKAWARVALELAEDMGDKATEDQFGLESGTIQTLRDKTEKVVRFTAKFLPDVDPDFVSKLDGVIEVFPKFPGETDADLSTIHCVDVLPSFAASLITELSDHPDIEYVEMPAKRSLK